jgi:glycosyltransferase involved in cell wall biosynthesis
MPEVLLVVSADTAASPGAAGAPLSAQTPRKDYAALAEALDADVLDRSAVRASAAARLVARMFGMPSAQAWLAFRRRRAPAAILTDGEHVGIPLAMLLKAARARVPHVTIGHRPSSQRKRPFFRLLKVHTHISRIALHSTLQRDLAVGAAGIPARQVSLVPYQVDTAFWRPQPVPEERLICSAGLEHRDYPTLFRAVDGLDVDVVIGAASYWSHQRNTAHGAAKPANVRIGSFDYAALRALYARAAVVVVPLHDVNFQAGVTTILEAMAMGKAVIVTRTQGQFDLVEDRRAATRSPSSDLPPRPRGHGLLRALAAQDGSELEPNGFYVLPGDAAGLRRAIVYLLDHPEERARLGAAGRRMVERWMTVDQFAHRLGDLVRDARAEAGSVEPAAAIDAIALSPAPTVSETAPTPNPTQTAQKTQRMQVA